MGGKTLPRGLAVDSSAHHLGICTKLLKEKATLLEATNLEQARALYREYGHQLDFIVVAGMMGNDLFGTRPFIQEVAVDGFPHPIIGFTGSDIKVDMLGAGCTHFIAKGGDSIKELGTLLDSLTEGHNG